MPKFSLFILILGLSFSFPNMVSADTGSFLISPAKIELVSEALAVKNFQITIKNNLSVETIFDISVEDFASNDNSNDLEFYGLAPGPYSLKNFITPEVFQVSLLPGEVKNINFEVNLPSDVSWGSLHGVVFFTHESLGEGNTQVRSRLGTLVFMKVIGEKNEAGFLKEVIMRSSVLKFFNPKGLVLSFKNTGNTYLNPYGVIEITNLLTWEKNILNIEPWFVLPNSTRLKEVALNEFKNSFYRAEVKLNRGYGHWQDTRTIYFASGIIGLGIGLVFILLISILLIKWLWFRQR